MTGELKVGRVEFGPLTATDLRKVAVQIGIDREAVESALLAKVADWLEREADGIDEWHSYAGSLVRGMTAALRDGSWLKGGK